MEEERYECSKCFAETKADDDFCPECGTLFIEDIKCVIHPDKEAGGACVICCKAFCKECGSFINDMYFLCNEHSHYEIYEGMARVYGCSDTAHMEYLKSCLDQAELHPIIFSKKASPLHLGGSDYSLFGAAGDSNGHLINEIKLMVPLQEVIEAEKFLKHLDSHI